MVQNLVYNLCESFVENVGGMLGVGKKSTPITYLTQWKIVGNSQVHTDPYLTSWKVSGNSVVNNNTILSCGDLGQDGKYHVKISNGIAIFDIPLDAPLRKVNDVADTIEFPSGTDGKALVTRNLRSVLIGDCSISKQATITSNVYRWVIATDAKIIQSSAAILHNVLSSRYETVTANQTYSKVQGVSIDGLGAVIIYDAEYTGIGDNGAFKETNADVEVIYELETPTTELIDVSPFPVSATNTYISANVTPYSVFEHTENKEIWSCGEYNATDGKYHILVQPQGGSIADIALDEPLRKVNSVADSIEFPSGTEGKALVTRNLGSILIGNVSNIVLVATDLTDVKRMGLYSVIAKPTAANNKLANILCSVFKTKTANDTYLRQKGMAVSANGKIQIYDPDYNTASSINDFKIAYANTEVIYELATPTTELVDAPQIEEAESYSMVISQGGKAVEWSSFETE